MPYEASNAFSALKMFIEDHPYLKEMEKKCKARFCVLVHPSQYRSLKRTYPTDIAGVITPDTLRPRWEQKTWEALVTTHTRPLQTYLRYLLEPIIDIIVAMFGASIYILLVLLLAYHLNNVFNRPLPDNIEDTKSFRLLDEGLNIIDYLISKGLQNGVNLADYQVAHFLANKGLRLLTSPKWNDGFPNIQVSDLQVSNTSVKVFRVRKKDGLNQDRPQPAMVYFHGGGWTWFSPDAYENFLLLLANKTQVTIFAVDYRKPPGHPFPAAYRDCLKVTKYVGKNADVLEVNPSFLMVAGDGAGGNLAAAVARRMASIIFLQILINPALQSLDFRTPSYLDNYKSLAGLASADRVVRHWQAYANVTGLDQSAFLSNRHVPSDTKKRYFQYVDSKNYLPQHLEVTSRESVPDFDIRFNQPIAERWEKLISDDRFSPSLAPNVSGLPNAYIITSQHDVLRDEAIMYADRLLKSGVKIRLKHYEEAFHGFLLFSSSWVFQTKVSQQALNELVAFFDKLQIK